MKEALINGLIAGLSGKVGKEFIIFLISMVPILELRGGLLAAGPALLRCTYVAGYSYLLYWESGSNTIHFVIDHKDF